MNPRVIDGMSRAMADVYGAVTDRVLVNMARHFKLIRTTGEITGAFQYQAQKLAELGQVNRETAAIILESLGGADEALQDSLHTAVMEGLKDVEKPLRESAEKGLLMGPGFVPPELQPNQTQAFQAFYRQSADKLNLVNTVMLESTENAYRSTVSDIAARISRAQAILNEETGEVVSGVTAINQAIRDGVRRMVDNGLTGYVDHGGHRWTPEAYVAMDIRTTMANTARAASWERMDQYGDDLYVVSWHDGARPLCYPWQGKVISRSGRRGTATDGSGNTVTVYAQSDTSYGQPAGLFGINCGHFPTPFIEGYSIPREPQQTRAENDREYAESQRQRALERTLREQKRDLAVMKAQGDDPEAIRAQREKVRAASGRLDDFCEETGRSRIRSREATPVNAAWPVISGQ